MNLGAHAGFILAAYAAAIVVIGGLIWWVAVDYRAQTRTLAELDARGITRRSSAGDARR
jgi:heme exporter protein D